ncbi:MAG: hypothetical protein ACXVP0_18605 [Bacteroidia bacterium]
MKTLIYIILALLMQCGISFSQTTQVYDTRTILVASKTGNLTHSITNPKSSEACNKVRCYRYQRNPRQKYDNIKFNVTGKLTGVQAYASHDPAAPKLKMKIFTTAPAGTVVEIQLGRRGGIAYPDGTYSQFQTVTTVSNDWEELEFNFSEIPQGSKTDGSQINQITILFNPNSMSNDIYYFDEISGPVIGSEHSDSASISSVKENK